MYDPVIFKLEEYWKFIGNLFTAIKCTFVQLEKPPYQFTNESKSSLGIF